MSKAGRNDPCPCGSGKKYKKCCLPKEDAAHAAESEDAIGVEEALEGYALSPSEQKRWLDRGELRAHQRMLELGEAELAAIDPEKLTDFVRWGLAQRLRDMGDRVAFESLRETVARSGRAEPAISYVDLLESHIHEVLRPRGSMADALAACELLIKASKDPLRAERSQALKAALLVESGATAAGEDLFQTLARTPGALLHDDDHLQALLHTGDLARARSVAAGALARPGLTAMARAHFEHALRELEQPPASAPLAAAHNAIAAAERALLARAGQDVSAAARAAANSLAEAGAAAASDQERTLAEGLGRRALDLLRHTGPRAAPRTLATGRASLLTCRGAADQIVRWLLGSRHQAEFVQLMSQGLGEVVGPGQARSSEVMETFASWVVCDARLPGGSDVLSAFRKASGTHGAATEAALDAMQASHLDLYDVVQVEQDRARLRRHGEAATHEVPLASLPLDCGLGHVLLGRMVELDDGPVLLQGVRVPLAAAPAFHEQVEQAIATARANHAGVSRGRLLKLCGSQIVQGLSATQKAWEKDGLPYPRTSSFVRERIIRARGEYRTTDGARAARLVSERAAFAPLDQHTHILREHALESYSPAGPRPLASVTIDAERVTIDAFTRMHLERARALLQDTVGSSLHGEGARLAHAMV
ncbi:MAG: SEC-C metal-binding domain-containing protein [Planctomycetota bacterium]